jgi:hypothetical protein
MKTLQDPGKQGPMGFERDQLPRTRNRRMVRRRVFQTDAEKIAQCERVRRAPRDAPLRVDALEIANQEQPKIALRRQLGRPIVSAQNVAHWASAKSSNPCARSS